MHQVHQLIVGGVVSFLFYGYEDLWLLHKEFLLVVYHYGGTWEQWSHRKDTRGKRTRRPYNRRHYDKQSDDSIRQVVKAVC